MFRRLVTWVVTVTMVGVSAVVLPTVMPAGAAARAPYPLPPSCAPSARLAARIPSLEAMQVQRSSSSPLKDVAIQPASLTPAQWGSLLDLAQRAGVGVVKVAMDWSAFEPSGPSADPYNWAAFKQFIGVVHARHMAVRFQIEGFPQWARDAGDPTEDASWWYSPRAQDELERWATWIRSVVRHFGTTVSFYEIWNEENNPPFWPGGVSPEQYAQLLACTYVAAKSVNPHVRIVSGGLSTNDVGYLEQLYRALGRYPLASAYHHFFDMLGVHPYSGGRSPALVLATQVGKQSFGIDDCNYLGYTLLHQVMASKGESAKQMYFGEYGAPVTGYPAVDTVGFTQVPESTRAAWVGLAYRLAARTPYVVAISWYTLYAESTWALLRNPDGSTNPTTSWIETPSFAALAAVPSSRILTS